MAERAQRAATSENTCKLKKHQQIQKTFNLTTGAANVHNTTNYRNAQQIQFFIWLCCVHLQCLCCQDEVVFLICWCFLYLQYCALSATVFKYFQVAWEPCEVQTLRSLTNLVISFHIFRKNPETIAQHYSECMELQKVKIFMQQETKH